MSLNLNNEYFKSYTEIFKIILYLKLNIPIYVLKIYLLCLLNNFQFYNIKFEKGLSGAYQKKRVGKHCFT